LTTNVSVASAGNCFLKVEGSITLPLASILHVKSPMKVAIAEEYQG